MPFTTVIDASLRIDGSHKSRWSPPRDRLGHSFSKWRSEADLAEVDAHTEFCTDRLFAPLRPDLDHITAGVLVELVEFEVAVIVAPGLGDRTTVLEEAHARALDAIDDAVRLRRNRAADETFRVAPEI